MSATQKCECGWLIPDVQLRVGTREAQQAMQPYFAEACMAVFCPVCKKEWIAQAELPREGELPS